MTHFCVAVMLICITHSRAWLKKSINTKLSDLFINDWFSTLEISRKCCCYKLFKDKFGFEDYLIKTPHNFLKYVRSLEQEIINFQ